MKNKLVWLAFLCVLLMVVLILCGCQDREPTALETTAMEPFVKQEPPTVETPYYTLEAIDGEAYLTMKTDVTPNGDGTMSGLVVSPSLKFSSAAEMRDKLLSGNLTESEVKTLGSFAKNETTGKIELCNLNQLYEPIMGKGSVNFVTLRGKEYSFSVTLPSGYSGYFMMFSEDKYQELMDEKLELIYKNEKVTVTKDEQITDRNAREISFYTSASNGKMVIYTKTDTYGTYTIIEEYLLSHSVFPDEADQSIPQAITVYLATDYGVNGEIRVSYGKTRPSVEELTSIGIQAVSPVSDSRVTE